MFPGPQGEWYVAFEEVSRPDPPLPASSPEHLYHMGLPRGYDKSQYLMEGVVLESTDQMASWREIARNSYRFQHTIGLYGGCARTRDGRFLRFTWPCYCFDGSRQPHEILDVSDDHGKTWSNTGPFHDPRFASYAHRLRTLRDGTLVLCLPLAPRWGTPENPARHCKHLDAMGEAQMTVWYSFDQGRTWRGPLPIYAGQYASETDFVELSSGDLLFVNNSIFAFPGRQIVYRDGERFTPGPMEKAKGNVRLGDVPTDSRQCNVVPESVCLTDDDILVGCMRPGTYFYSDDLGRMWQPLPGTPQPDTVESLQVYQPSMCYLGDGRIACTGHYGGDDPINYADGEDVDRVSTRHRVYLHTFTVQVRHRTRNTVLLIDRVHGQGLQRWPNAYDITLLCKQQPLSGKELEFWYVERYQPGYDSYGKDSLEQRMAMGGELIKARTDATGHARIELPHLDKIDNPHLSYQFVVRFNTDLSDPDYKPAQSPQFEFYANWAVDPPLG